MTNLKEVYKCEVCGNIVELLHAGPGTLVCCGKPMNLLAANTSDAAKEKHVPVIEKTPTGFKVKIGSIPHPMLQEHYIEWVELYVNGTTLRQHLSVGALPEAEFCTSAKQVSARIYCNLHGLWKSI